MTNTNQVQQFNVGGVDIKVYVIKHKFGVVAGIEPSNPAMRVPRAVSMELCSLAAGRDAWMRKIQFPCARCGKWCTAEDLFQSDLPEHCDACAEKYFACAVCGCSHHPDDGCVP